MGAKIPQDIDIGLDQAKIDPDRVNELDLADLSPADQLRECAARPGV